MNIGKAWLLREWDLQEHFVAKTLSAGNNEAFLDAFLYSIYRASSVLKSGWIYWTYR